MDYLKNLSVQIGGKIRKQDHLNGNFQVKSFRALILKDYKHFKFQINDYDSICSIEFKINTDIAFAINKPDRIMNYRNPLSLESVPFTVYVSESNLDLAERKDFLHACHSIGAFLKEINISPEEAVFVYRNAVLFALNTNRNLISILDDIIELFNANNIIFKRNIRKAVSKNNLPEMFWPLVPLLKKYSVSDDSEREQVVEGLKKVEIRKIIESVDPYMNEINIYLNSYKEKPLNEEATLLGNLAELVTELKLNTSN